ncbi:GspE/PulE family protein [Cognatiyoonia sp. IB215182]|uniref:GspE/PulE family protein n=1 Tax=Cognatiyoonia sp. IB215182 TaxID=3097353 RepID=UPI002A150BE8|nr:GspE/PulE family protein [Cognatiyoonia sp. IB215182]MDX8355271.1 GspE/PulE family protein [Cognatiyoonia sp. IB215182]
MDISADLLDALLAEKIIPGTARDALLSQAEETGLGIDQVIMARGLMEEAELISFVGNTMGLPVIQQLAPTEIDQGLFAQFDQDFWEQRGVAPLRIDDGAACLATGLPYADDAIREVSFLIRQECEVALCPSQTLRQAIQRMASDNRSDDTATSNAPLNGATTVEVEESSVGRGVELLVADAVSAGASDIHLDALESRLQVRFRVNGVLRRHAESSQLDAQAVFARLKLMGGMSVTERRLPQDGSCSVNIGGRSIELRLSSLPTQSGESIVCRLLDPKTTRRAWSELGFDPVVSDKLLSLIAQPYGMLIISGPTGSGKTTTLYTALQHLNDGSRKIITVEDPVEQNLSGIEQVQVNAALGLTFGRVLRTTLRHDPDVLMIGEIRDEETAEIACRAALIGRLVLATVHASTARLVRERFINLGVAEYLIDEVLLGVLSQRLEAISCSACGGQGCASCDHTGRVGRTPDVELWQPGAVQKWDTSA